MSINQWPIEARPRERLLRYGAQSLSDAELLAIFLRTGVRGSSAIDLAQNLLHQYGSLHALLAASQERFCQSLGLGQAKYALLQATLEMNRRQLLDIVTQRSVVDAPEVAQALFRNHLAGAGEERFCCMFLDTRNRLLSLEEMFRGSLASAPVYPRELVKRALEWNAAALIVAHNHPSGVAEPSCADREITVRLVKALALVDVRLLDHLVIGVEGVVSFAERGWM